MRTLKNRSTNAKKDNREKVEIRFEDQVAAFERTAVRSYQELVEQNRDYFHLTDSWQIAIIRAEEDRIIVECADGANPFWFSQKLGPPIRITEDKIHQAATSVAPGVEVHPNATTANRISESLRRWRKNARNFGSGPA
jgi:hypothetical protein